MLSSSKRKEKEKKEKEKKALLTSTFTNRMGQEDHSIKCVHSVAVGAIQEFLLLSAHYHCPNLWTCVEERGLELDT